MYKGGSIHARAAGMMMMAITLLLAGSQSGRAQVGFGPPASLTTITAGSVAVTDVNGDRRPDVIVASFNGNTLKVFTNRANGSFSTIPTSYSMGNGPFWITTAVIQAGSRAALISANANDNTISVLTNNGSGIFQSNATYYAGLMPHFVLAADVNGDSNVDLITADYNGNTLFVLTNNGSGIFGSNAVYNVGHNPDSVCLADIYGTGKPALICANYTDSTLTVLTNDGAGNFNFYTTLANVNTAPQSVSAVDIDGTGRLALITACYYSGLVVLPNNGTGLFPISILLPPGTVTYATAADMNGDGKVDLISANNYGNSLTVFTNNGSGTFGSNTTVNVGSYPVQIVAADLNRDGGQDLIVVNLFDNGVSVLLNSAIYALKINHSGNSLNVSWPSVWAYWALQQNTSLATTNWVTSTGVLNDGTTKSLTLTPVPGNLFFRLNQ